MSLLRRTILTLARTSISRYQRSFYDWRTRSQTIYALATAIQPIKGSPLAIIRISGPKTTYILRQLTNLEPTQAVVNESDHLSSQNKTHLRPRYAKLCKIIEPTINQPVDVGLVLWFPKPNSYTGEDACELHVHGSVAVIKKITSILGGFDAVRPAEPGEFTRRAVENGKISLIQAESLSELISSQTDQQRKLALQGLSGSSRGKYDLWIQKLIHILAHLEASIDFGEDELIGEQRVVNDCTRSLEKLANEIALFINVTSKCRDFSRVGPRISILGRPNAGKSTLMNLLCRQERSIVSDVRGTTRDVVEHSFELNGHTVNLSDTAGIRDLTDRSDNQDEMIRQHEIIEREGMRRALHSAQKAELLIYVIDGNEVSASSDQDLSQELLRALRVLDIATSNKILHLVINKMDLNSKIENCDLGKVEEILCDKVEARKIDITLVSCMTEENTDLLIERLSKSLDELRPTFDHVSDDTIQLEYANERHLALLGSTLKHLQRASRLQIRNIDEMAQHVRESVDYLSRIVGSVSNEQVFDIIFRDFCIGK